MPKPRPKLFDTESPRGLLQREVGWYLGIGESRFRQLKPQLEREGFPKPDSITGRYDRRAIDLWLDQRSGIAGNSRDPGLRARIEGYQDGTSTGAARH